MSAHQFPRNHADTAARPAAEPGDIETQYGLLLENMPSGYALHEMLWDEHGAPCDYRFLYVNPAFERLTGLARGETVGRTLREVLPGLGDHWVRMYGDVVRTGQSVAFEWHDGQMQRHWSVRAYRTEPNRFAAVFEDITRFRAIEDELRHTTALQRAMIRTLPLDCWARDTTGRVVMQSDISVQMWGDLSAGPDCERAVPETTRADWHEVNARAMSGEVVRHDHEVLLPDGTHRTFHSVVAPVRDQDARQGVMGILGINIDITERLVAEQALRRSEARFRSLIENAMGLPVQGYDRNLRVFFWNAASERLYGYSREEALGRRLEELVIPPDEAGEVRQAIDRWVREGASPESGEMLLRHKDGGPVLVYSSHVMLHGADGEPEMYCIDVDLNELRRAEVALRESERRYRTLVDNLPGAVYRCEPDPPWRALFISERVEELTGYPAADYLSGVLDLEQIIHPEDRARVRVESEGPAYPEGHFALKYRVQHADGTLRTVYEEGRRVRGEAGEEYIDGVILDITPLHEALRDLAAARDFLDAVMEAMPSALVGVGNDGRIIHWNRAAEIASGLSRGEAQGKPAAEALPQLVGHTVEVMAAVRQRRAARFERLPQVSDGRLRHLDVLLFPLGGTVADAGTDVGLATGSAGEIIVRVDDVTERTRLADMLVQTEKMLSVGGLAGGMAHELNNPLGAVLQGVQNIMRRFDPELPANARAAEDAGVSLAAVGQYMASRRITEMLEGIRDAGSRAAEIIATMLEFARPGQGRRTTTHARVLVERALGLAGSDYDLRRQYDFRKLRVLRDFSEQDDSLTCVPTEIEQVLLNLFKNAAQAMSEKRYAEGALPELRIRVGREGDDVVISVEDNGPGLTPEARRRVFEPFFTTKAPGVGTGLGLAVSYFIITRTHGGSINCDEMPGEGARFTLRLPSRQLVDA